MSGIGGLLRRRWKLSVLTFVLCVLAAAGAGLSASPTYSFSSTVLLLPPKINVKAEPGTVDYTRGNPLFYLGALNQTRDILIGSLSSQAQQADLAQRYPGVVVAAAPDVLGSGPVIVVEASGTSAEQVAAAAKYRVRSLPALLSGMQRGLGIAPDAMVTSNLITEDREPTVSHKSQIRMGIGAGGAIAALGLVLIAVIDTLARGRRTSSERGRGSKRKDRRDREPVPAAPTERSTDHLADLLGDPTTDPPADESPADEAVMTRRSYRAGPVTAGIGDRRDVLE